MQKPFLPIVTIEEVYAFSPDDPATFTKSPLVNAVAEVLFTTKLIECKSIAQYLKLDERKLSNALSIELGMTLKDMVVAYRTKQVEEYRAAHPDYTPEQLAEAIGYSSAESISRFLNTQLGITPAGNKSHRSKDHGVETLSAIRAISRMNLSVEETRKMIQELK